MAARKKAVIANNEIETTSITTDVPKALGVKKIATANEDQFTQFAKIKPGVTAAYNGTDIRGTFRFSRKAFVRTVAGLATAAGLTFGGGTRVADIVKTFEHGNKDTKPTVQKVNVQLSLQEGARYEFRDLQGNKMVWGVPARPSAQSAPVQLPAPAAK